jgi:hypothetical protein
VPDLGFAVLGAEAVPFCAVPTLALRLRVTNAAPEPIQSVALECQVRIEAARRRYDAAEQERLRDLFGEPALWSRTMRSLLWCHVQVGIPPFTDTTDAFLHLPCTFDFNVQATRYFDALGQGEVPLLLLFSGSVFYADATGRLQVERIPWSREASYRLPVTAWREVIDRYYPNSAWLCLRKDVFDRLAAYKAQRTIPDWDGVLEALLEGAQEAHPT